MNLDFLQDYYIPVIVGICLCLGYIVKKWIADVDNKYIPTMNALVGLLLALWLHSWRISPDIILAGMFSGLAATGVYELFRQLLEGRKEVQ